MYDREGLTAHTDSIYLTLFLISPQNIFLTLLMSTTSTCSIVYQFITSMRFWEMYVTNNSESKYVISDSMSDYKIIQLDGNISVTTTANNNCNDTIYDDEKETFDKAIPANFAPDPAKDKNADVPLEFDVKKGEPSSSLPFCLVFNVRSIFNKCCSLRNILHQFSPNFSIILESWEKEKKQIKESN